MSNEDKITIELLCLDKSVNLDRFLSFCFAASDSSIDRICLPTGLLNFVPEISEYLTVASQVDFPDGLSSSISRTHDVMYSLRNDVKCIDITINNVLVTDGNWKSIISEVNAIRQLCSQNDAELRVILEYRLHPLETLVHLCDILHNNGVKEVISSTGRMVDDATDNLLTCERIKTKTGIEVVACGRIYTEQQMEVFNRAGIKKFRLTSLKAAENMFGNFTDS